MNRKTVAKYFPGFKKITLLALSTSEFVFITLLHFMCLFKIREHVLKPGYFIFFFQIDLKKRAPYFCLMDSIPLFTFLLVLSDSKLSPIPDKRVLVV